MTRLSSSYTLGLIFIALVSVIWAAASVLVQFVYSDKVSFDSPFLLTYTGVSLFACFLPVQWLSRRYWKGDEELSLSLEATTTTTTTDDAGIGYESIQTPPVSAHGAGEDEEETDTSAVGFLVGSSATTTTPAAANIPQQTTNKWTTRDHVVAAAKIAPVWFISNYAYNASLKFTSITSSTVLASTGSLFTFLFALIARDEHFSLYKFFGICLGMAGSIMTGLHDIRDQDNNNGDSDSGHNAQLWGDFLGLLSAVGYGGYAIMVRSLCPRDESLMSMQLFLGFVGLWNMVFLSPIAIYQACFMSNSIGLTWFVFGCLIVKGLLDNVLSDYLWARAVVLTSATVATVGLGLTIPLAFASDVVLGRPNVMDAASIFGALSVLSGFVLVNLGQQEEVEEQQQHGRIIRPVHPNVDAGGSEEEECHELQLQEDSRIPSNGHGNERLHMSMEYRDEPAFQDEL
jgi:solute carrier family 35 protein F5